MLQPGQNNLLARFGDLTRKKDFIEDGIDLIGYHRNAPISILSK